MNENKICNSNQKPINSKREEAYYNFPRSGSNQQQSLFSNIRGRQNDELDSNIFSAGDKTKCQEQRDKIDTCINTESGDLTTKIKSSWYDSVHRIAMSKHLSPLKKSPVHNNFLIIPPKPIPDPYSANDLLIFSYPPIPESSDPLELNYKPKKDKLRYNSFQKVKKHKHLPNQSHNPNYLNLKREYDKEKNLIPSKQDDELISPKFDLKTSASFRSKELEQEIESIREKELYNPDRSERMTRRYNFKNSFDGEFDQSLINKNSDKKSLFYAKMKQSVDIIQKRWIEMKKIKEKKNKEKEEALRRKMIENQNKKINYNFKNLLDDEFLQNKGKSLKNNNITTNNSSIHNNFEAIKRKDTSFHNNENTNDSNLNYDKINENSKNNNKNINDSGLNTNNTSNFLDNSMRIKIGKNKYGYSKINEFCNNIGNLLKKKNMHKIF